MSKLAPLEKAEMPKPLKLRKLLGPSFILLGLGLGSGELILWPYLSANFGLGIMWGALLGITFQFFLNMEIERYALVTGESIFVGLARKLKKISPVWFILSTLLPWMWPGIIASCATVIAHALGIEYSPIIAIGLLILIGIIFTLGSVIYKTEEFIQRGIILIGVPFIFIMTLLFAEIGDWQALAAGLVGQGQGYRFLPAAIPMATFLGAFAYAGAGGNLNLGQSYYVKEKGYGMGKYAGRITSLLTGKKEKIKLEGTTFEMNDKNLKRFNAWWKRINLEHLIVFWATGAFTMFILSLLAYTTVFGNPEVTTGITFVLEEARVIGSQVGNLAGAMFLAIAAAMLFGTQFSVFGSTSRIMSENLTLLAPDKFKVKNIPVYFYVFLWLQILAGIIIFLVGFTEPLTLVVISAVLNAFTMFVYSGLLIWINTTSLKKQVRPNFIRVAAVSIAFIFYGVFSGITIFQNL